MGVLMTKPVTTQEPLTIQEVIEKVRTSGDVTAAIYIQTFAQQKVATQIEATEKKSSVVRLAYGLLWHTRSAEKVVHEARRVLRDWLNDKDQQKIGIEEAKHVIGA
jgi:hypothetical protein